MRQKSYKLFPLQKPIKKTITLPGSKSFTNRALIMAALADGRSALTGASLSDDSRAMISALKKIGIRITNAGKNITVYGEGGRFRLFNGKINVGAAGTAARFLISLCALVPGEIILDGSERMRQRPINELVSALRKIGAKIQYQKKAGCLPVKIRGENLTGRKVKMPGKVSSQFLTSLLLIAPVLKRGIEISVTSGQISRSYIDMTLTGLKERGIKVKNHNYKKYEIKPGARYKTGKYEIESDASGASYFFALAALTGSAIRVKNISPDSSQGDVKFCDLLRRMGCEVKKNARQKWIEVRGKKQLRAITADMENMPDSAQTLAVVAAFAKGKTKITGLSTLRHKETDRLKALKTELKKMGIKSQTTKNSITIAGGQPRGAKIKTYDDHRMAMAFAVAGARIPNVIIENPGVVSKSFPEFWRMLKGLRD